MWRPQQKKRQKTRKLRRKQKRSRWNWKKRMAGLILPYYDSGIFSPIFGNPTNIIKFVHQVMWLRINVWLALHFLQSSLSDCPDVLEISLLPGCLVPKQLGMDQTLPGQLLQVLILSSFSLNWCPKLKLVLGPHTRIVYNSLVNLGWFETLKTNSWICWIICQGGLHFTWGVKDSLSMSEIARARLIWSDIAAITSCWFTSGENN